MFCGNHLKFLPLESEFLDISQWIPEQIKYAVYLLQISASVQKIHTCSQVWKMCKICKWCDWWCLTLNPILHQVETMQQRSLKPGRLIVLQAIIVSLSICRYSLWSTLTLITWLSLDIIYFCLFVFTLPCVYLINNTNAHLFWCLKLIMVLHNAHINNGELSTRICYNLHVHQIKTYAKMTAFLCYPEWG